MPLRVWLLGAEDRLAALAAALAARGFDAQPAWPAHVPARGPVVVDLDNSAALARLAAAPALARPRLGWASGGRPSGWEAEVDLVLPPEPTAAAAAAASWLAGPGPCVAAVRRWSRQLASAETVERALSLVAEEAVELPGVAGAFAAGLRLGEGAADRVAPGEGEGGTEGGSVVERGAVVAAAAGCAVSRLPTGSARVAAAGTLLAGQTPAEVGDLPVVRLPLGTDGDILLLLLDSAAGPSVGAGPDVPEAQALADVAGLALAAARRGEKLREALTAAVLQAQALDRAKTSILANVSHELRTPLVPIKGYTELVLKGRVGPVNDTQREFLSLVLANVERLVTLIDNLLVYARLGQGGERLVRERLDLREVVREAITALGPAADAKGVRFEAALGEAPVTVRGDRRKLAQVFVNVLSNAVKFNRSGGRVSIQVAQVSGTSGDWVTIRVVDTGIGIPAEALDRVFDRFYQVDWSFTRQYGGAGLGLSIVKELVTLHGGQVQVSSTEGEGTTVVLGLPRSLRGAGGRRR